MKTQIEIERVANLNISGYASKLLWDFIGNQFDDMEVGEGTDWYVEEVSLIKKDPDLVPNTSYYWFRLWVLDNACDEMLNNYGGIEDYLDEYEYDYDEDDIEKAFYTNGRWFSMEDFCRTILDEKCEQDYGHSLQKAFIDQDGMLDVGKRPYDRLNITFNLYEAMPTELKRQMALEALLEN